LVQDHKAVTVELLTELHHNLALVAVVESLLPVAMARLTQVVMAEQDKQVQSADHQ
jgi:hypothetical protein